MNLHSSSAGNSALIFLAPAACILLALFLERSFHLRKLTQQKRCQAPPRLPQKDPVLGIDTLIESYRHILNHSYLSLLQSRFTKYGNTHSFNSLGPTVINTIDPENVQAMLAKQFEDFGLGSRRKAAFDPLIGHGIFTSDGPAWQEARRLIRPGFEKRQMYDVSMFEEHVHRLFHYIPRDGTRVDLLDLFMRFTIDASTAFLFGQSSLTLGDGKERMYEGSASEFAAAFNRAQRTVTHFFSLGHFAFLVPKFQFRKDRKFIHEFVDQYVRKALSAQQSGESPKDTSDVPKIGRYQFLSEYSKYNHDPEVLRAGVLHILLAGRDSTASLLGNLWLMLSHHPGVWKKLQDEVSTLKGAKPTYESLKQLTYLRHCINECKTHPWAC
jgi:cytochrome P450